MAEFRSDLEDFQEFGKIYRLSRDCIITEKIDGTNAQVVVLEDGRVLAGSRNRWITPEADNFGFARWVKEHEEELRSLGPGRHYGEWWGSGIQRGYGLKEKRFSLFNVSR
ncbi:MAG TPA: RNA ligase family protein, partial [Dehalococcoidia bacterium]|nr:RNA ligase family protein [Dehalococcoidia bacterium]